METHTLICHTDTPARTVDSIRVESERTGNGLWLRFHAELELAKLRLPDPAEPDRTDGLWQSTCFEAFVRPQGRGEYSEFNFSPSSQWAAYLFASYRGGMAQLELTAPPPIYLDASEGHFALESNIPSPNAAIQLALSAVIEETDGTRSYWALAHPPGKPDFHHPTCFAATLAAPQAS